jgi:polyphosphate glucokinase
MIVLGPEAEPITERLRIPTPRPATPKRLLRAIAKMIQDVGPYDRVSLGFPGVVVDGVVKTAPNLHPSWHDFPLQKVLQETTRRRALVINDAGVQGYGAVEGRGVEMLLTLGTGMGAAVFYDGVYVPNLELGHHPLTGRRTYEAYVGAKALAKLGRRRWSRRVVEVVEQVLPIWNPRILYLGGGNARRISKTLPSNVKLVPNTAGLLGGVALWRRASR